MTFATQLQAAFTPIAAVYDEPSITQALAFAQSVVTSYCNQTFDLVTETVYLDPQRYRTALLPQIPVVAVNSVQALLPPVTSTGGGLTWQALTNYRFVADTGLIYDTTGEPGTIIASTNVGPTWPWLPGSLQVNYSHGYATVPGDLINVAVRFAQQYLENPTLQMQRRAGDIEDRFSGSIGLVINQLDKTILGRYTDVGIA
jgi:hypothetical protein